MKSTIADLGKTAEALVEDGVVMHPKMPSAELGELLAKEADPAFHEAMGFILLAQDLAARARKVRIRHAKEERKKQLAFAFHSPVLREHLAVLPARLRDGALHVTQFREELKLVNADDRDRHKNSKRRAALQAIIDLFPKSPKKRRISLAELDALKARKAGLIE